MTEVECLSNGARLYRMMVVLCGGGVFDAVGRQSIGCQIGRTSPRSCFRG